MINNPIKDLFRNSNSSLPTTPPPVIVNSDERQSDESYDYYGRRICGQVNGSNNVLGPFLHRIYNAERQSQINDSHLQEVQRNQLRSDLAVIEQKINQIDGEIRSSENFISSYKNKISQLKEDLLEAKDKNGTINKPEKIKFSLGFVILAILTLYLIIFYSSTFYSAFFKSFDGDISVGAAMFDSQSLPNAFRDGLGELLFILCAPIIFMGLGFSLHFFAQQKTWAGYLKATSVILVTFIFDCILAYLIAKKIYNIEILTKLGEFPDFNVGMALKDENVWAVIFCGFIVYIIWGIVFDMTITAYNGMKSNKKEIDSLQNSINALEIKVTEENQKITENKTKRNNLESERQNLIGRLNNDVFIDHHPIKSALSQFFTGWLTIMSALSKPQYELDSGNQIYEETVNLLFNNQ